MTSFDSLSQWDYLLKNLGVWHGSFTQLSPHGDVVSDTPTCVSLEGLDENQTVRQVVRRFSPETGQLSQEQVFEYRSLNRSVLVFEAGAFSQGSIQWAPFTQFGAELGFMAGDRRLRLVELFDGDAQLSSFTLIREALTPDAPSVRPSVTVDQLVGEWQGEAVVLYPDLRGRDRYPTQLRIQQKGDRLEQCITTPTFTVTSTADIHRNRLLFPDRETVVQVLLLPEGASATTPLTIPKGRPFFLEAGWLISPTLRQRMIRRYDERGGWESLTLVTEQKMS
ncbi:MAG: DUF3598 family protein [Synechococcales cyanobacterium T60_A2020_003]|nr:DUF3598 family protein [Synechococcales cyanobacterium T60_A2020_003]